MQELIDRLSLIDKLDQGQKKALDVKDFTSFYALVYFKAILQEAPTIEAEPVRHGRWLNTDETVWDAKEIDGKQQLEISIVAARCSVCERWTEQVNNFPPYMKHDFCPHCGARMDGCADNG